MQGFNQVNMPETVGIPDFEFPTGPVKWCKVCGRKHPARGDCNLEAVTRIAKSGREVTRYAQKQVKPKSRRKNKARKS